MKRLGDIFIFLFLAPIWLMSLIDIILCFPTLLENFNEPDINESIFIANMSLIFLAVFTFFNNAFIEKYSIQKLNKYVLGFPYFFIALLSFFFLIKSILWFMQIPGTPFEHSVQLSVSEKNAIFASGSLFIVYSFLMMSILFLISDKIGIGDKE